MSAATPLVATAAPSRRRPGARAWRWWRARPASLRTGLLLMAGALLLAIVGSVALGDPNHQDLNAAYSPPLTSGHLLGTDPLGRDVLTWIAHSIWTSLTIGCAVVALAALAGTLVGLLAGWVGGVVDAGLMRLVDLMLAIPPLLMFLAASATVGTGKTTLILLISAVAWVPYARLVRGRVQVERGRASVAAARLAGATRRRILFVHLLPPTLTLVVVLASLQLGFVFLAEAGLSFVGLGVQPPSTSLGFLIAGGREAILEAWWVVLFPCVMLVVLLVSVNLIGDGLQEEFGVELERIGR